MSELGSPGSESPPQGWFRTILYSIGDAVITTGPDGRVRELNPPAEMLTGWSEAEARNRPVEQVFRIVDEDTRTEVPSPVLRVLANGATIGLANHTVLVARDGTERPVADSAAPILDDDGTLIGVVLVFRGQTAERAADRALRESEARLREAQQLARLGSWEIDLVGSRHSWSDEFYRIFELERATAKPSVWTFVDMVHPDDRGAVEAAFQRSICGDRPYELVHRIVLSNTEVRHVRSRARTIFDEEGRAIRSVGTLQDITYGQRAEERLKYQAALLEGLADAVISTDADHRILTWNRAAETIYGWKEADVIGKTVGQVLSSVYKTGSQREFEQSLLEQGYWRGELRTTCRDGSPKAIMTSVTSLTDRDGRTVGVVAVNRDITEVKELQAVAIQAQKMESVGRLAGGVAHDFNNTVQAILNYAELALERVAPDDPLADDLRGIEASARRSANLTRQLLTFARKQTAQPKVVDLNDVIVDIGGMLERLIGESVQLTYRRGTDLWLTRIDRSQVDQVLANLAVNARDAIPGTGEIEIETANVVLDTEYTRLHPDVRPGEYVAMIVRDTGSGMSPEVLSHLFEPFFTTKEVGKGTGLGLATVYGIVKQYGGSIDVTSEPSRGSTFRIFLPRWVGDSKATGRVQPVHPTRGTETILVVEDEPHIMSVMRRALEREGYRVLAFSDPLEAAAMVETGDEPLHLLVTDVVMPGLTGRQLVERVTARRTDLPCLYISGYSADVIADHGVVDEGIHFLGKPFTIRELAEKVRTVLDGGLAR